MAKRSKNKEEYTEKVNVCGVMFDLIRVYEDSFNRHCHLGEADFRKSRIRINNSMDKEQQEATLIHEWLHAILDANSYHDESGDEKLISCLQTNLYLAGFRVPVVKEKKQKEGSDGNN